MKKRGQSSFEYVIIVGLMLVFLVPLLFYSVSTLSQSMALTQAENAIYQVVQAADEVYALSPGSRKIVHITLPKNTHSSLVNGSSIVLTLGSGSRQTDVHLISDGPLIGSLPTSRGTYTIPVEHLASGIVQIGSSNDTTPPIITFTAPRDLVCNPITLSVTTDEPALCKFGVNDSTYAAFPLTMGGTGLGHSYSLGVQNEGSYLYYVRCQDYYDNVMNSSSSISYSINFTYCNENDDQNNDQNNDQGSSQNENEDEQTTVVVALLDIGVDNVWSFKTPATGLKTNDTDMSSWNNITNDVLDDNVNTPSTSYIIRTRSGENYEGFVAMANISTTPYSKIVLYARLRIIDESPFTLRVYPYKSDGTVNTANYSDHVLNSSILSQKVKWVEMDITNIAKMEDGFGWLRTRITALNASTQDNDRLQFSELHYKVG